MSKKLYKPSGFTLIELLLAMALFISVLFIFTLGYIGISRTFTRELVRKELSEGVQASVEGITRAIRSSGASSAPFFCSGIGSPDPLCSSQISEAGWQSLCFGSHRFYWHASDGGLFQDIEACSDDEPLPTESAVETLSTRFLVNALTVSSLASSSTVDSAALFEIKGVFRTKDDDAFQIDTDDPFQTRCKGTAQSQAVLTCAIENFSFIVNARGGE